MRKRIFHNWGLKLASLILAFLLWLLVVQINDPKENETFTGIPVTLINTELLEEQNKAYAVLDNTDIVRVTVRGPRSVVEQLSASDIVAEADVSKLTEINTIAINFSVMNADTDVEVIGSNPDVLRLSVEDRADKWVNVRYGTIGEVAEGYIVASAQPNQNRIRVTGPKSSVDQISYASVEIDVSGATTSVSANVERSLYNAEGDLLDLPAVSKSVDYVLMQAEVLAVREIPISLSVMGTPADGFQATGVVEYAPTSVLLAGTVSALENVRIVIPEKELDITGATGNVTATINIRDYLPDNIRFADSSFNGRITATVYVEPEVEHTFEIDSTDIALINVPEGLRPLYPYEMEMPAPTYVLRISGLERIISTIRDSVPAGTADIAAWMEKEGLERLGPGEYDIPVMFQLPAEVTVKTEVVLHITLVDSEE